MVQVLDRFAPLFHPRSVAVIGASNSPGKWGFGIFHNLMAGGYLGKLYPVNHKVSSIQGLPCFAKVADLPEAPDLALIIVPPLAVAGALKELIQKGCRSAVIITAGFGELGPEGAAAQAEIARLARDAGLPVIGPNCMGIVHVQHGLHAQLLMLKPPAGNLSVISQSGNIVGSIMHYGNVNRVGFNKAVSSGNEAVVKVHDLLEYLGEDETTAAVLMYLEGVPDGHAFLQVARKVSLKKPVVVLKGGVTAAGGQACASHTGHLAGSAQVFAAAARQCGLVLVDDLDELYHVGAAIAAMPRPRGPKVGIVTMGGGWGVLAADTCVKHGLQISQPSPQLIETLDGFLAERWSHANPFDLAATPDPGALGKALAAIALSREFDMIVQTNLGFGGAAKKNQDSSDAPGGRFTQVVKFPRSIIDFLAQGDLRTAEDLVRLMAETQTPIVSCTDVIIGDSVKGNPTLEFMAEHGIPVHPTPVKAAHILGKLWQYWSWRDRAEKEHGA